MSILERVSSSEINFNFFPRMRGAAIFRHPPYSLDAADVPVGV